MKKRVLVVEDDPVLTRVLRDNLTFEGFEVESVADGAEAQAVAHQFAPDLVLLDVNLPGRSGFDLCQAWRERSQVPIILLTAMGQKADKVRGLQLGADDYVTKPFSPRELVLRIKKLLQRSVAAAEKPETMRFGDLLIDQPKHLVSWKGRAIELTATEFKLVTVLAQRAGRVQSRDTLLRDVWEYDATIDTRTVDTHMRRLREKLGPAAKHLDTVRGVGYRFVE